jgi:dihydroorotate dehydrogenase/Pyruvate/2-oxoacid:ferredoxin oxidoreductase delta subunit
LKNPLVAGSGPLTHSSANLKKAIESGFGAIVTKTCTSNPYFRTYPRMDEYLMDFPVKADNVRFKPDYWALYQRDHLQHLEPELWVEVISKAMPLAKANDCKVLGSIEGGSDLKAWVELAKMHEQAGVDGLELNFCCPHPMIVSKEYEKQNPVGAWTGKDPVLGASIVSAIKAAGVKLPVFPKLTPEAEDPSAIAAALKAAGAEGVTCLSRNLSLRIDIEKGQALGYSYCSTSGPGTKEFALRWVAKVASEVGIAVMGANGPVKWQDFIEFMMGGANAVQSCSAVMIYGFRYVKELLRGMEQFMDRKGYKSADELVGLALPIKPTAEIPTTIPARFAVITEKECNGCTRCLDVCYYNAISVKAKKAKVDADYCVGCGLCQFVCPSKGITYQNRASEAEYVAALRRSV